MLNELRRRRILHPDLSVVERVVATAMGRADWRVFNQINGHLGEYQHRMLDHWLAPEAVEQVRREIQVPDEYLQYLSPLGWDHINLTGDYIWNLR